MGIIKAASHAVGTGLSDQWLEALEPDNMGAQTVFAKGVQLRKGTGENGKGSDNMVTEGSIIHVYPEQCMILVDGGKVVDYCLCRIARMMANRRIFRFGTTAC